MAHMMHIKEIHEPPLDNFFLMHWADLDVQKRKTTDADCASEIHFINE